MPVNDVNPQEMIIINNLKRAWFFILNNIDYPIDLRLIKQVHHYVGSNLVIQPGQLCIFEVKIGETNWKPDLPNEDIVEEKIGKVLKVGTATEQAIKLMLFLCEVNYFLMGISEQLL